VPITDNNNDCWTYVQEARHEAALEKETTARIQIENDLEEKCRQLHVMAEDKNFAAQQLSELRLLTKKVSQYFNKIHVYKQSLLKIVASC